MATDTKSVKGMAESLEFKMKNILIEVESLDVKLRRINKQREKLMSRYEEIKQAKEVKEKELEAKSAEDWNVETCEWSPKVRHTLKTIFKLDKFRPQQLQAINCVMSKKDTLLIIPTGGGKSICYQLPAVLAEDSITIVVSPLISLMEDQVWSLKKLGINAELLAATCDKSHITTILKQMMQTEEPCPFRVLYVTPERLAKSKRFMNALQKTYTAKKLHLIAIDEVHCCSQWGHDFRPDYKFLGNFKTLFPDTPILGTTATATTEVITDIQKMLNLSKPIILKAEFNRPNLYYHVLEKPSDKEKCVKLLANLLKKRYAGESGIIYTFSITETEELSTALVEKGLKVRPYHASLASERRTKIHSEWLSGKLQAVVATVAFGMGIDKPDVRFVIHHTMSKSMENFYQESGRAGRDGERAECILLYRCADMSRITSMMFTEYTGVKNAYNMIEFAIDGTRCRRDLISQHFSDVWSDRIICNKMCDRCFYENNVNPPKMEITESCLSLYKIIDHANDIDEKLTFLKLIDAWYRKGKPNLRVSDVPIPDFERFYGEQIIAFLIIKDHLKEDFHFSAYTTFSYIRKGKDLVTKDDNIIFYGARILNLPKIKDGALVNDEHSGEDSHEKRQTSNSESSDSRNNSDHSKSKKKKKEKRSRSHSHSHSSRKRKKRTEDDCIMIADSDTVIEIDD